jgi:hypothetical protein
MCVGNKGPHAHLEIGWERILDVDEDTGVVFPDLVYEHGTVALYKRHCAMLRDRKRDVFQDSADKIASYDRALAERATVHDRAAKVGEAAVCDDDEIGKIRLLMVLAGPARAHTEHAARERALDQVRHRRLEEVDAWRDPGTGTEVLDKAAVVEGAAISVGGVRYVYGLFCVKDGVAVYGDCIDAIEARTEAEGAQRSDAAWL